VIDFVKYDDRDPWPVAADGDGPSLELIDTSQVNYLPENWGAGNVAGGTPGVPNSYFAGKIKELL
jgi:hypothetical protein